MIYFVKCLIIVLFNINQILIYKYSCRIVSHFHTLVCVCRMTAYACVWPRMKAYVYVSRMRVSCASCICTSKADAWCMMLLHPNVCTYASSMHLSIRIRIRDKYSASTVLFYLHIYITFLLVYWDLYFAVFQIEPQ